MDKRTLRSTAASVALCLIGGVGLGAPAAPEPAAPNFKPMDVFDLQWAADPQISPDGRSIAYVRMGMDVKTDRARGTIWLVAADGGHARPLSGADSSFHPRWSPDGSRIAYLATGGDGSTQLFVYWVDSTTNEIVPATGAEKASCSH